VSSGPFLETFYLADSGEVHPIRHQPETSALVIDGATNEIPAGPATSGISAKVSGGRRQLGLTARSVTIRWTGAPPTGYLAGGEITLPWFQPDSWLDLAKGQTGTYLGTSVTVQRKTQEFVR